MLPSKERTLAREFELRAVERLAFGASTLSISRASHDQPTPAELIQRFEYSLKKESKLGFFHLTESEFEIAFEVLVALQAELSELKADISLSRFVKIQEWRIDGKPASTVSSIHWDFGSSPCISTFLRFNSRAEFDYIRAIFEELKICRLNEKHLKPIKARKIKTTEPNK